MPHFKAFDLMNMQYEIRICQKILNKATNDKNQHAPPLLSTLPLFLILFACKLLTGWSINYKSVNQFRLNLPQPNGKNTSTSNFKGFQIVEGQSVSGQSVILAKLLFSPLSNNSVFICELCSHSRHDFLIIHYPIFSRYAKSI